MSVVDWCAGNGITKANYYYRLRRVRKACLESIQKESVVPQSVVPIEADLLQQYEKASSDSAPGLDITIGGGTIRVTEEAPLKLLTEVLEVMRSAQ